MMGEYSVCVFIPAVPRNRFSGPVSVCSAEAHCMVSVHLYQITPPPSCDSSLSAVKPFYNDHSRDQVIVVSIDGSSLYGGALV